MTTRGRTAVLLKERPAHSLQLLPATPQTNLQSLHRPPTRTATLAIGVVHIRLVVSVVTVASPVMMA